MENMDNITEVVSVAWKQIDEHARDNHACEAAIKSPPRKSLPGLVDDRVLRAANGIHLPWLSSAKATWASALSFSGVEVSGSQVSDSVERLEDDLIRESDNIAAALVETGFCAVVFGVSDDGKLRLRSYSGKRSTVVLDEWGDPEYGFLITGRKGDTFEAEVHSKNSFVTVQYRIDEEEQNVKAVKEGERTDHNLGVCLVVPLTGKRIIGEEAVAIQSTANLVEAMSTASQALHTSPRELFGNVPLDAIEGVRGAVLGSPLNGPVVLPRVPESRHYGSDEERNLALGADSGDSKHLETQEVKYERSFGGDGSSSYAEQIKRIASSFALSVPLPEGWATLTPGALNGILDAKTQARMGQRFFDGTSRMNRQTSKGLSRAVNSLLAALGEDARVEVVFGDRTPFENDAVGKEGAAIDVAEFLVARGVVSLSSSEGLSAVGKLLNLNSEFVGSVQRSKIQGRAQALLDDADARIAEDAAQRSQAALEGASEAPEGGEDA